MKFMARRTGVTNSAGLGHKAPDKMRRLLARYAASYLEREFILMEMLHDGGDFVLDLFMAVRDGPEIYPHDLNAGGEDWVSS
jgi:hypothetical protein